MSNRSPTNKECERYITFTLLLKTVSIVIHLNTRGTIDSYNLSFFWLETLVVSCHINVVVKIFIHRRKPGWNRQIGGVHHVHMYTRKWCIGIRGEILSHIVRSLPPWAIKEREGSLMRGLPILRERGIPLRSRVSYSVLGFRLGFSSWVFL